MYTRNERRARKILKAFGKEMVRAQAQYMDQLIGERETLLSDGECVYAKPRVKSYPRIKRVALVMVLLCAMFFSFVVVANALGFYPFNIKIINRSNHAVVWKNGEEATEEGITAKFYRISYVPEGYEQEDEYEFSDVIREIGYINEDGVALSIFQNLEETFINQINNENCQTYSKIIDGLEVVIFEYDDGSANYLLEKGNTYIGIYGVLPPEEYEKIIQGLC